MIDLASSILFSFLFSVAGTLAATRIWHLGHDCTRILRSRRPLTFAGYEPWNGRLRMSKQVHDRLCALAKNPSPTSATLHSTSPPTIEMTEYGLAPIIVELRPLARSLQNLESIPQNDRSVVATFHNHQNDSSLLEHDVSIFANLDNWLGSKWHFIGSPRGLRIYARNDPALSKQGRRDQP